jgi:predicted NACHT family NTPase
MPVEDWLVTRFTGGDAAQFLLIGDFGMGKSTLVLRLAYELSKRNLQGTAACLPVIIPFRHLAGHDLPTESALYLRDHVGLTSCTRQYLVDAIRSGRIVLFRDGLAESPPTAQFFSPSYTLHSLGEIITSESKFMVTSRPGVFRTSDELL